MHLLPFTVINTCITQSNYFLIITICNNGVDDFLENINGKKVIQGYSLYDSAHHKGYLA